MKQAPKKNQNLCFMPLVSPVPCFRISSCVLYEAQIPGLWFCVLTVVVYAFSWQFFSVSELYILFQTPPEKMRTVYPCGVTILYNLSLLLSYYFSLRICSNTSCQHHSDSIISILKYWIPNTAGGVESSH